MNIIEFGDCREIMRKWAFDGVKAQTCVTSPPYFALRDYGVDGQIGQEEMPEDYVAEMVDVFRCVKDVLHDDGTLFLNIGDTYASNGTYINAWLEKEENVGKKNAHSKNAHRYKDRKAVRGGEYKIKAKDLIGIPWRVAFALQADGWYLRNSIVWAKPSALPNPAKDRFNTAHELIFMFAKNKSYKFNKPESSKDWMEVKTAQGNGAHFAMFPPDLIAPLILAGSNEGDVVFDPFMGSGTTAQVALQLGRKYLGCELNPEYKELQDNRLIVQSLVL